MVDPYLYPCYATPTGPSPLGPWRRRLPAPGDYSGFQQPGKSVLNNEQNKKTGGRSPGLFSGLTGNSGLNRVAV